MPVAVGGSSVTALVYDQTQRDASDYLMSGSRSFSTETYALVSGSYHAGTSGFRGVENDVVGRFRSGHQINKRPAALSEWRVTTGDPEVAEKIHDILGGDAPQECSGLPGALGHHVLSPQENRRTHRC